jgi:hypothetical protein
MFQKLDLLLKHRFFQYLEFQTMGKVHKLGDSQYFGRKNTKDCIIFACYLCGLVVRVPGYTTEMYCVSCEVRTEFIYVM